MFEPYDDSFDFGNDADAFGGDLFGANDQDDVWSGDLPDPADPLQINRGTPSQSIRFGVNCGGTCLSEGGGELGGAKYEYWYDKD